MKRLGFWNRLAFVLTILAFFIAPAVIAMDIQGELHELRTSWYDLCRSSLVGKELEPFYAKESARCLSEYLETGVSDPWDDYWEMAGATLVVCAILYLLIWSIVGTAKWVWRGRDTAPPPVRTTPLGDETV